MKIERFMRNHIRRKWYIKYKKNFNANQYTFFPEKSHNDYVLFQVASTIKESVVSGMEFASTWRC